jgi:hypothetical protein
MDFDVDINTQYFDTDQVGVYNIYRYCFILIETPKIDLVRFVRTVLYGMYLASLKNSLFTCQLCTGNPYWVRIR